MKTILNNFKVNVFYSQFIISGTIDCHQDFKNTEYPIIIIDDILLTNVTCINQCEELYDLDAEAIVKFQTEFKANPIKYTPILWYLQTLFEKQERDNIPNNLDDEMEIEFLD